MLEMVYITGCETINRPGEERQRPARTVRSRLGRPLPVKHAQLEAQQPAAPRDAVPSQLLPSKSAHRAPAGHEPAKRARLVCGDACGTVYV